MSQLQKLLDEKYPFPPQGNLGDALFNGLREQRKAFTEGYNAAIEEVTRTIEREIKGAYPGRSGCTWVKAVLE